MKVAEGCDRACAFCAIPSFRGKQRSRTPESIEAEVRALVDGGVAEIVLVAQDLAWYGRDIGEPGSLAPLLRRLDALAAHGLARVRLLYLYPSEVRDPLVSTMLELPTVVPYFDLSLQHASAPLLRRMKRWGSGDRFLDLIDAHPRRRARRRVPLVVHRRLPGRDRARPRRAARVPRRGPARLGRLLPVLARGRHRRGHARRRDRRRARCASGCASAPSCRTRSRRRRAPRARRRDGRGARRRLRRRRAAGSSAAPTARRPRSTASSASPEATIAASGRDRAPPGHGRARARPRRAAAAAA